MSNNIRIYDSEDEFVDVNVSHDRLNNKGNARKKPVLAQYEQLHEKMNKIPKFMSLKKYQLQYQQKKKAELWKNN